MFNNFVNIHDLMGLVRGGPKLFFKIVSHSMRAEQQRVIMRWSHTYAPPTNWWDIPAVNARWNRLISGDSQIDYRNYIARKYLLRDSLQALSLGCGTGSRELAWAELGKFDRIDAYDLSKSRIQTAIEVATQKGYTNILNYQTGDVYKIEIQENCYDVVLTEGSLHHFSSVEEILLRINLFLKPGGYFIINEFVGPTRFQWTDRQIEAVNGLLAVLPTRYKTMWNSNRVKPPVFKPSILRMILGDPSEAIESFRIKPLLYKVFDVVEVREYGGAILHLLFDGIAHCYLSGKEEDLSWLDICFEIEDLLMANGDIQSDFIVAVMQKRT